MTIKLGAAAHETQILAKAVIRCRYGQESQSGHERNAFVAIRRDFIEAYADQHVSFRCGIPNVRSQRKLTLGKGLANDGFVPIQAVPSGWFNPLEG